MVILEWQLTERFLLSASRKVLHALLYKCGQESTGIRNVLTLSETMNKADVGSSAGMLSSSASIYLFTYLFNYLLHLCWYIFWLQHFWVELFLKLYTWTLSSDIFLCCTFRIFFLLKNMLRMLSKLILHVPFFFLRLRSLICLFFILYLSLPLCLLFIGLFYIPAKIFSPFPPPFPSLFPSASPSSLLCFFSEGGSHPMGINKAHIKLW